MAQVLKWEADGAWQDVCLGMSHHSLFYVPRRKSKLKDVTQMKRGRLTFGSQPESNLSPMIGSFVVLSCRNISKLAMLYLLFSLKALRVT